VAESSDTDAVSRVEPDDATADDTDEAKTDGVTPPARVSGTASAAKPAPRDRSMRSALVIGVVALVLAAVAVVAAFRPGTSVSNEAWVDAAATREVTDAAKHAIEAMHGYNYETIDEDFAEIRGLLTQERLEEFDATAEVTKQAAVQTRTVTEVNVLHIGTSVLDETQAEVAAYINVSATGDGIAQGSAQAPVLVRMEKTDGQWLVSEIRDR
jgi:Mce-associated membrane protein